MKLHVEHSFVIYVVFLEIVNIKSQIEPIEKHNQGTSKDRHLIFNKVILNSRKKIHLNQKKDGSK